MQNARTLTLSPVFMQLRPFLIFFAIDLFHTVTWRDFALLHMHGANHRLTLFYHMVFDNNLIRYL